MQEKELQAFMVREHMWDTDSEQSKFSVFLFLYFQCNLYRYHPADVVYLRNNLWVFFCENLAC